MNKKSHQLSIIRINSASAFASSFFSAFDLHYLCHMNRIKNNSRDYNIYLFIVATAAILLTIPWLGLGHFYTRGEPREALVAVAMLDQMNFILPTFQGEFAFKPPMLHWLVALFSLPQGHVSEFTARLPSAVASIAMVVGFFCFFAKRYDCRKVFIASLMMLSCFEVHRAAMTCRVDMVLTAFMVLAMLAMLKWSEQGYKGIPFSIPLLASGAILTKGPIGVILPCFVLAVYMLINRERAGKIILALVKVSATSAILPLIWYILAYHQAGDAFLNLVMEENFGRFLGKMSYESHENGPFYYIPMVLSGLLPWTLLVILGICMQRWKPLGNIKSLLRNAREKLQAMDAPKLFAIVVAVCVFVFYEIPKSKRGVYLLPMYPFLSLLVADFAVTLFERSRTKPLKIFAIFMACIGAVASLAVLGGYLFDFELSGTSRGTRRMAMQLAQLQNMPVNVGYIIAILLPLATAVYTFINAKRKKAGLLYCPIAIWLMMMLTLDIVVNPAIKNSVPDYYFAKEIREISHSEPVYFYRAPGVKEPIYTVVYYLDDKVKDYADNGHLPAKGYIYAHQSNAEELLATRHDYRFTPVARTTNEFTSFKGNLILYKFESLR